MRPTASCPAAMPGPSIGRFSPAAPCPFRGCWPAGSRPTTSPRPCASPASALTTDRLGEITQTVNGEVIVNYQSGTSQELVTQVGDLTQQMQWQASSDGELTAGFDLINGVENVPMVVNAAQLLANDTDLDP